MFSFLQLRGLKLEDADKVYLGLQQRGLSSVMSGMDNVRNITGSPIAGIDPHELLDSRPLSHGEHSAACAGAWHVCFDRVLHVSRCVAA